MDVLGLAVRRRRPRAALGLPPPLRALHPLPERDHRSRTSSASSATSLSRPPRRGCSRNSASPTRSPASGRSTTAPGWSRCGQPVRGDAEPARGRRADRRGRARLGLVRPLWLKVLWLLWPAWVWFAVMATGNHFWLDIVGRRPRRQHRGGHRLPAPAAAGARPGSGVAPVARAGATRPRQGRGTRPASAGSPRARSAAWRGRGHTGRADAARDHDLRRRRRRRLLRVPNEILCFWTGAILFVVGSLLDILDGALARQSGKGTPVRRVPRLDHRPASARAAMLGSIGLVFTRKGTEFALASRSPR